MNFLSTLSGIRELIELTKKYESSVINHSTYIWHTSQDSQQPKKGSYTLRLELGNWNNMLPETRNIYTSDRLGEKIYLLIL